MSKVEVVKTKRKVLEKNEEIVKENQNFLKNHGIKAIEFLGGPGSGKTWLINILAKQLKEKYNLAYIGGDIAGQHDAELISKLDVPAIQINTGGMCHLQGFHFRDALKKLKPGDNTDLIIVENVGNLICPFQLKIGSDKRVVLIDPNEGKEKFEKYPVAFLNSDLIVISKIDLLPALDVTLDEMLEGAEKANPKLRVVPTSAKTGEGLEELINVLGL